MTPEIEDAIKRLTNRTAGAVRYCSDVDILVSALREQEAEIDRLKTVSNFEVKGGTMINIHLLLCFFKYHKWIVYGYRRCCKFCNKKQSIQEIKEWKDEN